MTGIELGVIAGTAFTVGDAMMVAGAVTSATGVFAGAKQDESYQKYQAQVAQQNALIAEQNAEYNRRLYERNAEISEANAAQARSEADAKARAADRTRRLLISSQIATSSANGSLTGSGFDVIADDAIEGALSVVNERYAGEMEARYHMLNADTYRFQGEAIQNNYLMQADSYRITAAASRDASKRSSRNAPVAAGGTLLTGLGAGVATKIE